MKEERRGGGSSSNYYHHMQLRVLSLSELLRPFLGFHDTLSLSETCGCLHRAYRDAVRSLAVGFPWMDSCSPMTAFPPESGVMVGGGGGSGSIKRSPRAAGLIGLLGSSKRLRELELRGAVATGVALEAMQGGKWDAATLKSLVLRDIGMQGDMAARLADVLAKGTPKSLETLDVSSNCLSDQNTGAICHALVEGGLVKGLQELRMEGNDVRNDTLHALRSVIAEAGQLRVLGLGVAQAGVGGGRRREEWLTECLEPVREVVMQASPHLEELQIAGGPSVLAEAAMALLRQGGRGGDDDAVTTGAHHHHHYKATKRLKKVAFVGWEKGQQYGEAMRDVLSKGLPGVRELTLWSVEVGPISYQLGNGLRGLERLELRDVGLGARDVGRIGQALMGQGRIRALDLSGNGGIKCEGIRLLANALKDGACPMLEELFLDRTCKGNSGLEALAQVWGSKEAACGDTIRRIEMGDCGVGVRGVRALARALHQPGVWPRLEWLSLSMNEVCDEGAEALGQALKRGAIPELKGLGLWGSGIGELGAWALVKAIEARAPAGKIQEVDIGGWTGSGGMSGGVREAINRALRRGCGGGGGGRGGPSSSSPVKTTTTATVMMAGSTTTATASAAGSGTTAATAASAGAGAATKCRA